MQQQPVDVLQVAEAPEVGDVHAPALSHRRPRGASKSSRSRPTDSRRACRTSCGPRGEAGNNPCSRQGDQVVAPGSTGRRLPVEDDHGASGGTPILSSPMAWRRASAARRPLTGAHARMDVPLGEGSAGRRSGRSRDVRAWAPVCARFRLRLRSSARARTARSRVVRCGRLVGTAGDARIPRDSRSGIPYGDPPSAARRGAPRGDRRLFESRLAVPPEASLAAGLSMSALVSRRSRAARRLAARCRGRRSSASTAARDAGRCRGTRSAGSRCARARGSPG